MWQAALGAGILLVGILVGYGLGTPGKTEPAEDDDNLGDYYSGDYYS